MSKFLKVIVNLFLVFAILVAGAILVPPILGVSTTMIDSASMDTNLPVGSITYSQNVSVSSVVSGDKILIEKDNSVYVYVVESADAVAGKFTVLDETSHQTETQEHTLRNEALKVVVTVPLIGYLMVAMHSVEGLIIIGLVVLFVIILFILSELWKKTDDEDEEVEDAEEGKAAEEVEMVAAAEETEEVPEAELAEPEIGEGVLEASEEAVEELTSEELAQAIAETMEGTESVEEEPEAEAFEGELEQEKESVQEEIEEVVEEEIPKEEEPTTFIKVPRPTLDEIIVKAETAGDRPEIVAYDAFGITVVDYSDCI